MTDHPVVRTRPSAGTGLLLVVRFLTELAMVAALAVFGAHVGIGTVASVLFAVVFAAAGIFVWARFVAPKAARRLPDPQRLVAEIALFFITAVMLFLAGDGSWALGYAVIAILTAVAMRRVAPGG